MVLCLENRVYITQLVEVLDRIGRELDHGKQIDVLYLDLSKAFDRVSQAKLLHRLRQFGFRGNILKWFKSYLSDRRQRTTISGTTSKSLPVTSGVPQGSILGPLFLLYDNHLSNYAVRTSIATFADDTKIFRTINSNTDSCFTNRPYKLRRKLQECEPEIERE